MRVRQVVAYLAYQLSDEKPNPHPALRASLSRRRERGWGGGIRRSRAPWPAAARARARCGSCRRRVRIPRALRRDGRVGAEVRRGRWAAGGSRATRADRKSTRLTPVTNAHLVCRLLLEKKKIKKPKTRTHSTESHIKYNLHGH